MIHNFYQSKASLALPEAWSWQMNYYKKMGLAKTRLHYNLRELLSKLKVSFQYPEFIGDNHKPHVTAREGMDFTSGSEHIASAAYLIEVVDAKVVNWRRLCLSV